MQRRSVNKVSVWSRTGRSFSVNGSKDEAEMAEEGHLFAGYQRRGQRGKTPNMKVEKQRLTWELCDVKKRYNTIWTAVFSSYKMAVEAERFYATCILYLYLF